MCKSRFSNDETYSVTKCNDKRCGTCDHITEGSSYNFNNRTFNIKSNMNCDTKNVIYVITCPVCQAFYIGETRTTLRTRVRVHKQQMCNGEYRQLKVSKHLHFCGKDNFHIFPFYKLYSSNDIERKNKESYFIDILKPSLNSWTLISVHEQSMSRLHFKFFNDKLYSACTSI